MKYLIQFMIKQLSRNGPTYLKGFLALALPSITAAYP